MADAGNGTTEGWEFDCPKRYSGVPGEQADVGKNLVIDQEHAQISTTRADGGPVTYIEPRPVPHPSDSDVPSGCYDTVGLSLSGGGIRSAAFCTGALQGMAALGVLDKVDYLSTVSGGGYAGAALSVARARNGKAFPFLSTNKDEKVDTPAMRELRANANYLKFGHPVEMLKNLAIYLRGLVANCLLVLPVIFFAAAFTLFWNPTYNSLATPETPLFDLIKFFALGKMGAFAFSILCLVAAVAGYVCWSWHQSLTNGSEFKNRFLFFAWAILVLIAGLAFFEVQPLLVKKMIDNPGNGASSFSGYLNGLTSYIAPFIAVASFAGKYLADILKSGEEGTGWKAFAKKLTMQAAMLIAGLALPLLLWLIYLRLVYWGVDATGVRLPFVPRAPMALEFLRIVLTDPKMARGTAYALVYMVITAAGMLSWTLLTANGNSLHRLYRDRLSKAFCFYNVFGEAVHVDDVKLSDLKGNRQFHLINTALNIQREPDVNQHGRNADFFLFSPLFIGSKSTRYLPTEDFEKGLEPLRGYKTDLATAIAISGAAASSNMGSESIKLFSATLALLNVRLGYWFPNPRKFNSRSRLVKRNALNTLYYAQEIFGALSLKDDDIYLTDGGHVENLGAYELIRRRCQLVIVVDGEADKGMNFPSLIKLQRYARIDLGARIHLCWSGIKDVSLRKQANEAGAQIGPHCAIGRIDYDNGGTGILLYIKSSVTGDENDYIKDYNRRYLDFPHESTSDQFFSEEQFEVYRALGFHAVNGLLKGEHLVQDSNGELQSLRDAEAEGYGVKSACAIIGLAPLPKALLPHRPKSKSPTREQKADA